MNEISDMLKFFRDLKGGCFLGIQTSTQSVVPTTDTAIILQSEVVDTDGGHDVFTNTARYTGKTAGWYLAAGTVSWDIIGSGYRYASVRLNGSSTLARTTVGAIAVDCHVPTGPVIVGLNGTTDYLELTGQHSNGSAIDTELTFGSSFFGVVRLASF
jgi:hypothetical protein